MIKKILSMVTGALVFASISTTAFASTVSNEVTNTNKYVSENHLALQSKSMSDSKVTVIGTLDHAIRISTDYYKDSEGILYIDAAFDKWKGDPVPERFRPYRLSLDSAENHEIKNITIRSGAMILHINRLWYETSNAQTYNVKLNCTYTNSEGDNSYSFNGIIATFIN